MKKLRVIAGDQDKAIKFFLQLDLDVLENQRQWALDKYAQVCRTANNQWGLRPMDAFDPNIKSKLSKAAQLKIDTLRADRTWR
jgi:hypothetical protein